MAADVAVVIRIGNLEDEERPAGTVEERRKEIDELRGELKVLRAWRVVHFSQYVDAVDEARRLGYQEEYPPLAGLDPLNGETPSIFV